MSTKDEPKVGDQRSDTYPSITSVFLDVFVRTGLLDSLLWFGAGFAAHWYFFTK